MTKITALDPLTFPLAGQQLIEASAGTGKTYTITALYLRLLLGLGQISQKPLGPEQILVVTFTEAATEELRDRIRQRIVEARTAFLQEDVKDPFLRDLKVKVGDHQQAIKLLEQAARQMDEAAIFTIHGFCQRMLKQHAFESGSLFEAELNKDEQTLIHSAVLDFWRYTIYPLSAELSDLVLTQCWSGPEQLERELRGILNRQVRIEPDLSGLDLQIAYENRMTLLNQFKQDWLSNEDNLLDLIQASGVNKRSYSKNSLPKWLDQIELYVASEQREPGKKLLEIMGRFCQSTLADKTAKGEVPTHPLFSQIETLLNSTVPAYEILLSRAFADVKKRLVRLKQQNQQLSFDDLLTNLYTALKKDSNDLLSEAIREQFPIAMIDEFQDTDPLQYGIFSKLYANASNTALIMIGDPKQAIYAFRGADIFTYIQARRSVSETFTLDTNWRSTEGMVDGVNQLFMNAKSAFIYDQDIPFLPVKAADKNSRRLRIQEQEPTALAFWHQPTELPLSKAEYLSIYAQATAAEIDRLLSGDAHIGEASVEGADIAVLVRDRFEAEEVRRALSVYEHPCVYLSNQDSVFNSLEAIELSLILAAAESPQNERALRAALATEFFQQDIQALDLLNHDELAWEAVVSEFTEYRELWQSKGVLPMFNQLLQQRDLAALTLQTPGGERRLTNLMHLTELLQQASSELEGLQGLIRWFTEKIANSSGASDEQILRLESERNLVTIVTVHKSKGLEYPIVFLPFACNFREQKTAFYHEDTGAAVLNLKADETALEAADKERLAEELRLLYVALTRSVYRCYVGVSDIRIGNSKKSRLADSALGYLLTQSDLELPDALKVLEALSPAIEVLTPPDHGAQKDMFSQSSSDIGALSAREFCGVVSRDWRVSSYSALSRHSGGHMPDLPGLDLEVIEEAEKSLVPEPEGKSIFTFPKGANAGTFLHSVFEEISFCDYDKTDDSVLEYQSKVREQLLLAGYSEDWFEVIDQLVSNVLNTDLNGRGLKLSALKDQDRLVEMEFMLSSKYLRVAELESLIRRFDPLSAQARPLSFEPLKGMLKGFIDLLFRMDGRYFVLDYKSNHLGHQMDCYDQETMAKVMIDHRYDLQYLLYSLAVHRLLKQRIPDYCYEQHFGGVYYLFLRGIQRQPEINGLPEQEIIPPYGVFFCRPEQALIEGLDLLFTGETSHEG